MMRTAAAAVVAGKIFSTRGGGLRAIACTILGHLKRIQILCRLLTPTPSTSLLQIARRYVCKRLGDGQRPEGRNVPGCISVCACIYNTSAHWYICVHSCLYMHACGFNYTVDGSKQKRKELGHAWQRAHLWYYARNFTHTE